MTDGVASTTGVDLQIGSQERNQDLVLAGARRPGTQEPRNPRENGCRRTSGSSGELGAWQTCGSWWFLGSLLETGVVLESSAAGRACRAGRVAARSTRRGLGSCDVRNCFCAGGLVFGSKPLGCESGQWQPLAVSGREAAPIDLELTVQRLKLRRTAAGVSSGMAHTRLMDGRQTDSTRRARGGYTVHEMGRSMCISWPSGCRTNIVAMMIIGQVRTRMR